MAAWVFPTKNAEQVWWTLITGPSPHCNCDKVLCSCYTLHALFSICIHIRSAATICLVPGIELTCYCNYITNQWIHGCVRARSSSVSLLATNIDRRRQTCIDKVALEPKAEESNQGSAVKIFWLRLSSSMKRSMRGTCRVSVNTIECLTNEAVNISHEARTSHSDPN